MAIMTNSLKLFCLSVLLAVLSGCASVDFDYPKTVSTAPTDTEDTHLGRQIVGLAEQHPGQAAFYPQGDGIDALAARLLLAERAERTIDAQYYLLTDDIVGFAFLNSLLRAADRGVRVRLLLDDMFTQGYDPGLAALDSHPNFEVRIFNPFARRSARFMDAATSFSRINRRMHNKSFTVDNQITVIGGRNIANEYFGVNPDKKFGDLDVMALGPIVAEVSDMFDDYWNHEAAAPLPAFAKMPKDPAAALAELRTTIEQSREEIQGTPYAAAVNRDVLDYIGSNEALYTWAPYTLAYDSPDKVRKELAENAASITTPLRDYLINAEHEIIIVSPYFVPNKKSIEWFGEMEKRGVNVIIVTNSLAANNQLLVHGAYASSRKPLLEDGVEIYELRPDAKVKGAHIIGAKSATATLHTKAFIVDRRNLFIGSFNYDPRSAYINTELGVVIESPELAEPLVDRLYRVAPTQAYKVFLNDQGKLRWRTLENGQEVVFDKEPESSWWQRFISGFTGLLPIDSQL